MQETQVQSLSWEDALEKEMATHFRILAWGISRTEEPGRLQSMGSQRVRHDWAPNTSLFTFTWCKELTHWKDPNAVKDWGQEEKAAKKNELLGWHHWLYGHEFEQTPGDGEGQGSLVCHSPWGCRVRHNWATEQQRVPLAQGSRKSTNLQKNLNSRQDSIPYQLGIINPTGKSWFLSLVLES